MFSTLTVVPLEQAVTEVDFKTPEISNSSLLPFGATSCVAVVTVSKDRAHNELNASPLKPYVVTESKSSYVRNFDV